MTQKPSADIEKRLGAAARLDNIQTIPKESLNGFVVSLSRTRLREVQRAVTFALELDLFDEEI
jgi:hypothetical protein